MANTDMLEGEFLRELRRIKGWSVGPCAGDVAGVIRMTGWPCSCPVTAVANRLLGSHFDTLDWRLASWAIALPPALAEDIVRAADGTGTNQRLRAKLLEACGQGPTPATSSRREPGHGTA